MLHKYVNEDVSLGSWFIGLDVEQVDDRRLCCGTPPGNLISICFFPLYFLTCFVFSEVPMAIVLGTKSSGAKHLLDIGCYMLFHSSNIVFLLLKSGNR